MRKVRASLKEMAKPFLHSPCGLDLDIETAEKMLSLAGRSFRESDEDRALKFCITGFAGQSIEERNDFLKSYGYETLGTKERY